MAEWWYCDTKWGCGALVTEKEDGEDVVVYSAPVFRKLIGSTITKLSRFYDIRRLSDRA